MHCSWCVRYSCSDLYRFADSAADDDLSRLSESNGEKFTYGSNIAILLELRIGEVHLKLRTYVCSQFFGHRVILNFGVDCQQVLGGVLVRVSSYMAIAFFCLAGSSGQVDGWVVEWGGVVGLGIVDCGLPPQHHSALEPHPHDPSARLVGVMAGWLAGCDFIGPVPSLLVPFFGGWPCP